ncbi:hypothetical protein D3C73_1016390 [compost metagenome]
MCLWHPTVQWDNPGQQTKARHTQQPDVSAERQLLSAQVEQAQFQRTVALPHQIASDRQQQRTDTTQRKPQLAFFAAPGQEHRTQRHDFRHHHQRAEVAGNHGAHRRRHQQINQQSVGFYLRVTVPVDVVQADEQAAQTQRNQPDSVQRRHLQAMTDKRHHAANRNGAGQYEEPRSRRTEATHRTADTGDPAA